MLDLDLNIAQMQNLKLNTKLMQSMHMLQMSSTELLDYLEEQSVQNPLMEFAYRPDLPQLKRKTVSKSYDVSAYDDLLLNIVSKQDESLEMTLLSQLRQSDIPQKYASIVEFIAGSLNDDGYLTISVEEMSAYLGQPLKEIETALSYVQAMEPAGIGARSLRECLLIQINRDSNANEWAARITSEYLQEIAAGKYKTVADQVGITLEHVKKTIHYMKTLNPRPGLVYNTFTAPRIEPDAVIHKNGDQYTVLINEACYPQVYMNDYYKQLKKQSGCKQTKMFLGQYAPSIQWLIRSLEQRKATISRVVLAIMEEQRLFLEKGPMYVKPLILKVISEQLNLDISTVSRAVKNKYVQTPRGVYPLKYFFSSKVESSSQEPVSAHSIKAQIMQLVKEEDKHNPLSDQQITDKLVQQGLQISRRTVMKYREALHIASSRLRSSYVN
ncbi:RNA polymerase, sigma 54 subunit, RpoN/SigL [Paenibacillus sp. 1_12]|uniref:RNA polymerase factor sigma-54 n=1 Tax=Paenibacillus sp. 1_12 TaxID=1566278 RepID=UPI0008F297A6|nr:RNA polymerase factor sigma-54 [Paenibacillus sp. 1_12]SFL13041.1 RNA polymerase, sigma 54 subunit, RpoN/SigL [Paenibacillus sp. 1_12]